MSIRFVSLLVTSCLISSLWLGRSWADEGMYPISQIHGIGLAEKGLKLTPEQIFSPGEVCLVDGIVKVNGCTGSFVSASGLIITNHHCAYEAIQQASTLDQDYLKDGFLAKTRNEEIPAKGYVVRVTESFEDVSEQVLSAVNDPMDFSERTKALDRRKKELEKEAEEAHPGKRAEVAEMFVGKTYYRFIYTYIRDVRLVFAPSESIGKFGGDDDNWHWPRHTGDFSFLRAYVAPDGSSSDYSPDNVPYQPKKFIPVAPQGVREGDFVMLLGYPGRTSRHHTHEYLQYLEFYSLPHVVRRNRHLMAFMDIAGASNREIALKNLSRYQSFSNVEKRSRGQLKGLENTSIGIDRWDAETALQEFIDADPDRQARYSTVIADIGKVYEQMAENHPYEADFDSLRTSLAVSIASTIYDAAKERTKPDLDREAPYMDRNFDQTRKRVLIDQQNFNVETDRYVLNHFGDVLWELRSKLPQMDVDKIDQWFDNTRIKDVEFVQSCFNLSVQQLENLDEPFFKLVVALYPETIRLRELNKAREGELNKLYGDLITVKQAFLNKSFIPDANGTLRLTFGTVRGYSPADAVSMHPFTTVTGMLAKATGHDPFIAPEEVKQAHLKRHFGPFKLEDRDDVPVAMLYDTDTTGGNSGSPVINANGELVGVNFDRTFEATINDFAWNTDYSRSIGVDIRYVLWITGVYGGESLLEEMGAPPLGAPPLGPEPSSAFD